MKSKLKFVPGDLVVNTWSIDNLKDASDPVGKLIRYDRIWHAWLAKWDYGKAWVDEEALGLVLNPDLVLK